MNRECFAILALLLTSICWSFACGDSGERLPAGEQDVGRQDGLEADIRPDEIVARVDGVPVSAGCVSIQAAAHGLDRRAALSECIDFELLAQAARARGLYRDRDVIETRRVESVRQFLNEQIVRPMPSVEGTDRAILERAYRKYRDKIYAPSRRLVSHVYAPFPGGKPPKPGTPEDDQSRELAERIHAALAERTGLTMDDVREVATQVAGDTPLGPMNDKSGKFREEVFWVWIGNPSLPRDFSQAVFETPEKGMVSRPTRSNFGWHVVLYIESEPARMASVDDAADWLFQAVRSENYHELTSSLLDRAEVVLDERALVKLQKAQDELRFEQAEIP